MSAVIVKASVTETDENLTPIDCELSARIRTATMAVLEDEIAMAEPGGEMPMAFWS
jgi:hypothetical protein